MKKKKLKRIIAILMVISGFISVSNQNTSTEIRNNTKTFIPFQVKCPKEIPYIILVLEFFPIVPIHKSKK